MTGFLFASSWSIRTRSVDLVAFNCVRYRAETYTGQKAQAMAYWFLCHRRDICQFLQTDCGHGNISVGTADGMHCGVVLRPVLHVSVRACHMLMSSGCTCELCMPDFRNVKPTRHLTCSKSYQPVGNSLSKNVCLAWPETPAKARSLASHKKPENLRGPLIVLDMEMITLQRSS